MPSRTLVQPLGPSLPNDQQIQRRKLNKTSLLRFLKAIFTWALWALVVFLVFGHHLSGVRGKLSSIVDVIFGQDPELGLHNIVGSNDEPFSDRAYLCAVRGRVYKPVSIRDALKLPSAVAIGSSDAIVNGYRMVTRDELTIDLATNLTHYVNICNFIAAKMEAILTSCTALGYNVTQDSNLRIIDGVSSSTVKLIRNALPVVVIPYYDNSIAARFAIPGHDGSACIFHINNLEQGQVAGTPPMTGLNRSIREQKTVEYLRRPGGTWRNGWYEDLQGEKWHSDLVSSDRNNNFGVYLRQFDLANNTEVDCTSLTNQCGRLQLMTSWGKNLRSLDIELAGTLVYASNGNGFGLAMYYGVVEHMIQSGYDLETFISNISLAWLLLRWIVSNIALIKGYYAGEVNLESAGIGVLSCARGFHSLPLVLLPRLKTYLVVFSTIGCEFEGPQRALSEAWFVMYPSIAELTLFVYSLLNLWAKLFKRRMGDVLFGPTLIFYCLLHYVRNDLAKSHWLEYDGRVTSLVSSAEFEELSVVDFFRSDIALRLNGNLKPLLLVKLSVLALSLLPLLGSWVTHSACLCATVVEKVLALRLASSGGFGTRSTSGKNLPTLTWYESLRLGYLVFGEGHLISLNDWITQYSVLR